MVNIRLPWKRSVGLEPRDDDLVAIIDEHPVFAGFSLREKQKLYHYLTIRDLAEGEKLLVQGDPCPGLILLLSGEVRLTHQDQSSQPVTWYVNTAGGVIGEWGLIEPEPSLVSAEAVVGSHVVIFDHQKIADLVNHHPKLSCKLLFNLSRFIGSRLRQTNERLGAGAESK